LADSGNSSGSLCKVGNADKRNGGIPMKNFIANASTALKEPEVLDILEQLAAHGLGIYLPHMHDDAGDFAPLPAGLIQVEDELQVSFCQESEARGTAVSWLWQNQVRPWAFAMGKPKERAAVEMFDKVNKSINTHEVAEMVKRLSQYELGVFVPHMRTDSGDFAPLPDRTVQLERHLGLSYCDESMAAGSTAVGWLWNREARAAATCSVCVPDDDGGHKVASTDHGEPTEG
jgi:hypothetical protein